MKSIVRWYHYVIAIFLFLLGFFAIIGGFALIIKFIKFIWFM